ncbi:MAG TPA: SDR family NAD(P)-dependent oxidoreductase [Steroidobacteraceae bacterium]|jgi:NAD(P)-dependent dehydrogenase (short-subunit alcohol dehydrogenase family)|nr:SDR family NAD(P)-dependent oxidoreductase [Steroidobacteraceae bacterium]
MHLDGSVAAVVTGGASGLGEATARALAGTGVRVTLFDTDAQRGQTVATQIGGLFTPVDVTADASVERGLASARAAFGQERILVNCAGIIAAAKTVRRNPDSGAVESFPMTLFERVLQVNLGGTFRCLARSAAGMVLNAPNGDGERGVIINTASVAAVEGQIGQAAYAASKAGVVGLTLPVARDLAAEGIRVNAILPGIFETPMINALSAPMRSTLAAAVPFPSRLGRPAEFARLVLELCRNAYLNGAAIRLDGAIRMTPR